MLRPDRDRVLNHEPKVRSHTYQRPASGASPSDGLFPARTGNSGLETGTALPCRRPNSPGTRPRRPRIDWRLPGVDWRLPGADRPFPGADGLFPGPDDSFPGPDDLFLGLDGLFPGLDELFRGADELSPGMDDPFPGCFMLVSSVTARLRCRSRSLLIRHR